MASAPTSVAESTAGDLALHATGFELSLRATRKAPNTIKSYLASIVLLDEFLADKGMPRTVENIRRQHIESFQSDQLARLRPASAGVRHRSLKVFVHWLAEEGQIKTSPMQNIKPPTIPMEPPRTSLRLLAAMAASCASDEPCSVSHNRFISDEYRKFRVMVTA